MIAAAINCSPSWTRSTSIVQSRRWGGLARLPIDPRIGGCCSQRVRLPEQALIVAAGHRFKIRASAGQAQTADDRHAAFRDER
jgi:hypothetical protein